MKLAIRIQHNTNTTRVDRKKWINIMIKIINDSRVKIHYDSTGDPYNSLCNLFKNVTKEENPTHLLILQDDILPCFNFIQTVESIANEIPNETITFFTISKLASYAVKNEINWVRLKVWYYTQSYIMPIKLMGNAIEWINKNVVKDDRMSDDERFAMYFYFKRKFVYATTPSLVEHIGWNSTSLKHDRDEGYMNNRNLRMANKFIGVDKDPLSINWMNSFNNSILDENDYGLEDYRILFRRFLKPTSKYKI